MPVAAVAAPLRAITTANSDNRPAQPLSALAEWTDTETRTSHQVVRMLLERAFHGHDGRVCRAGVSNHKYAKDRVQGQWDTKNDPETFPWYLLHYNYPTD